MADKDKKEGKGKDAKTALLEGLRIDLQGEYQAVIMYRTYASLVQGPYRQELRAFFEAEIPEELNHARILADKISALGGEPPVDSAKVKVTRDAKQMLQYAHEAEVGTIARYLERREQAEAANEHGLSVHLDDIIADETHHRDELQQMLARWP
jgi:bacterioferritin